MNDENFNGKEDINFEDEQRKKHNAPNFNNPFKITTKHKIAMLVLLLLALALILFIYMPILNPVYSQSVWLLLLIIGVIYFIISGSKFKPHVLIGVYALLFVAMFLLQTPILWSGQYYDLIGDVEEATYSESPPNIDDSKIPVVDEALATNLGDKKLGEDVGLGSQYTTGEYYFITTDDDLAWVAPLEPRSFFKWLQNRDGAPGYIYVSATDPNDVRLVRDIDGTDIKLRYTNDSYLFRNIKRHTYLHGNMTTGLTDYSFEIDDEGNPYWVITTYAPAFNIFAGRQATGVVTVDAQSGDVQKYSLDDEMPDWIERVWPTEFIMEQINYHGEYVNGWLNTIITQKNMVMPTDGFSYVFLDGEPYLYTGLTSVQSDDSTVGMMIVSLRDKTTKFYKLTGATESAAMASSEGQVQQYEYSATFPILLNVYNEPTYFMTLKDKQGLIKQYSYVSVENYNIVGIGETMSSAKKDYYEKLKSNGTLQATDTSEMEEETGTIERINIVDDIAYIKFEGDKYFYMASTDLSNDLLLTQPGDKITYKASSDSGELIEVVEFDNNNI